MTLFYMPASSPLHTESIQDHIILIPHRHSPLTYPFKLIQLNNAVIYVYIRLCAGRDNMRSFCTRSSAEFGSSTSNLNLPELFLSPCSLINAVARGEDDNDSQIMV